MSAERIEHFFLHLRLWSLRHQSILIIVVSFALIIALIHFLGWWEALGLLFLKFGLGAKVAGAKSFTHAIIKAGGKKAIAVATVGMLTKRHIIDLLTKFFAEHSVKKYKRNLTLVMSKKIDEIKRSTVVKKIEALGSMLISVPIIYFFWAKVLGTAIQKFVYILVVPLFTLIWNLFVVGFNFLTFIFQLLMLNLFLETLTRYRFGRGIIALVDGIIRLIGKLFSFADYLLSLIGIRPKAWLAKLSMRFNRWLESILDRGLSLISKVEARRDRYINSVERLSEKRYLYAESKKEKKISYWLYAKKLFTKKVLKQRDWRESRKIRQKRWSFHPRNSRPKLNRPAKPRVKRQPLKLPYRASK